MPVPKGLNGLSKVPEQVPPIGDLDGRRGALTDPVGIDAGTIAGDDLDAGPITQPAELRETVEEALGMVQQTGAGEGRQVRP